MSSKTIEKYGDIILIDDDESFGKLVQEYGSQMGVCIDCYTSLLDLGSIGQFTNYDAAIIDYNLDCLNGIEIAEYFPPLMLDIPVVLVSGDFREDKARRWPKSIRQFVKKSDGIPQIIETAIALGRENIIAKIWDELHKNGPSGLNDKVERLQKYPSTDKSAFSEFIQAIKSGVQNNRLWETCNGLRSLEKQCRAQSQSLLTRL